MRRFQNVDKEEVSIHSDSLIYKSVKTLQLDKGQDHVDQGNYINNTGQRVDWVTALDGHGNSTSINAVRKADFQTIMATENPALELQKVIDNDKTSADNKLRSGATFIAAKMYENEAGDKLHLDISYAGDSIAVVICNGEHIFTTEPHTYKHSVQMMRLIQKGVVSASDPILYERLTFELVNSDTLISKQGKYIKLHTKKDTYDGYLTMAPSNSIGHNGLYGSLDIDTAKFIFKKTDSVRVVLMSDGVSDVVDEKDKIFVEAKTPTDIVNYAHDKWRQTWNCIVENDLSKIIRTVFPKDGYDDCCAAIMDRKPYVTPEPLDVFQIQIPIVQQGQEVEDTLKACLDVVSDI